MDGYYVDCDLESDGILSNVTYITASKRAWCWIAMNTLCISCCGRIYKGGNPYDDYNDGDLCYVNGGSTSLAMSDETACAIISNDTTSVFGEVKCWPSSLMPNPNITDLVFIVAGQSNSFCGIKLDGSIICWQNDNDAIVPSTHSSYWPSWMFDVNDAVQVVFTLTRSCYLSSNGAIRCWYETIDITSTTSGTFPNFQRVTSLALTDTYSCSLSTSFSGVGGALNTWGATVTRGGGHYDGVQCRRPTRYFSTNGTDTPW
jgi:hypothetical protein